MFYRLAFTSGLLLASSIALAPAVLADTAHIDFSGTIPEKVTFGNVTPPTVDTIFSGSDLKTFRSSSPARLSVQSNNPATITVSPPYLVSGPSNDPQGTNHIGFLKFGSTNLRSDVGGGSGSLPAGNLDLEVDVLVERPEVFIAGTYTYAVTLTVTP